MPSRPSVNATFSRAEWGLLVRLPGQVVVGATSAGAGAARSTVAEGLAGINAIAAGRSSDNPLVRRVVETIYAEHDEDAPDEFDGGSAGLDSLLASCRRAAVVLAGRASPADRAAYRGWLESIAARACGVAGSDSPTPGPVQRQFLTDMSKAFDG